MIKKSRICSTVMLALALATLSVFTAVRASAAGRENVTLTVTAAGKNNNPPPPIKKNDVQFFQGKERTQIADWRKGETLYLAILIDDSLDATVAQQWPDLKTFLMAQPDTTYIAVAYAQNGAAMVAQDFTKDHALAANALRLPLGSGGAFTSPYLALQDWMKRWPDSNERKSVLLFSSGIDYFRGTYDPVDPDVDTTIEQAQKKNINIWSIYAPDAGHRARQFYVLFLAQGFLSRVAQETGAEAYYLGYTPPVTFKPYFDELEQHLNNQYLLSFVGNGGPKGRFERVHLTTELPKVEFFAASQVFLPAEK